MKRLLLSCILFASVSTICTAQHTSPRYGTASNQNKTYGGLAIKYDVLTDATLLDTISLYPSSYNNEYTIALKDTLSLSLGSIKNCFRNDKMTITFSNASGANHFVYLRGSTALASKWETLASGGTLTFNSAKSVVISFIFDGALWQEVSRCIH